MMSKDLGGDIDLIKPCSEEFSLYKELGLQIQLSLPGGRGSNPDVKIELSFDKDIYNKGLRDAGYLNV